MKLLCKQNKMFRPPPGGRSLRTPVLKLLFFFLFFAGAYFAGMLAAFFTGPVKSESTAGSVSLSSAESWGLSFHEEGQVPEANASFEELAQYRAFYAEDTEERVIYLTFDCGYENGNTSHILDVLQKHNVTAAFFVVGTYIESEPELIRRMADEGHIVGNHTWSHPDMSQITSEDAFRRELEDVEAAYKNTTGKEMIKYYRPPCGLFSTSNLAMAKELGYTSFFWSLAYVDWYEDDQPTREEAFDKLTGRIHPGAIVLLHNTSDTNAEILDELLTRWEEAGYRILPLTQIEDRT